MHSLTKYQVSLNFSCEFEFKFTLRYQIFEFDTNIQILLVWIILVANTEPSSQFFAGHWRESQIWLQVPDIYRPTAEFV